MSVTNIESLEAFKAAINSDKLVVVDFNATWCGPCKMIKPIFHQMAKDNTDVVFLSVDVDEQEDIAAECEIEAMPTFHFYKNGEKVDSFSGASEQKINACIAKYR